MNLKPDNRITTFPRHSYRVANLGDTVPLVPPVTLLFLVFIYCYTIWLIGFGVKGDSQNYNHI